MKTSCAFRRIWKIATLVSALSLVTFLQAASIDRALAWGAGGGGAGPHYDPLKDPFGNTLTDADKKKLRRIIEIGRELHNKGPNKNLELEALNLIKKFSPNANPGLAYSLSLNNVVEQIASDPQITGSDRTFVNLLMGKQ